MTPAEGTTSRALASDRSWTRTGLVLCRSSDGDGRDVVGDPCIVWDPQASAWRMVLFYDPPGHADCVSSDPTGAPGTWSEPRPLRFTNPELLPSGGGTQKPFVVMDAYRPNRAAVVEGKVWLVSVSYVGEARDKRVQRAWAASLAGPWTLEPGDLITRGGPGEFDENHVDAVSGYWFEDRGEFLYFYMGYPLARQPWGRSPYGNAIGAAVQRPGSPAVKSGVVIAPADDPSSWVAGYLGGLQLLPGREHRWEAVINGSPTAPDRSGAPSCEEPAPSLGGMAYTDAEFPTSGWVVADRPFETIAEIPESAIAAGEGVNLWRHHLLAAPGVERLFYNSGPYGREQLYSKQRMTG